jgi:hypothetical protein
MLKDLTTAKILEEIASLFFVMYCSTGMARTQYVRTYYIISMYGYTLGLYLRPNTQRDSPDTDFALSASWHFDWETHDFST